MKRVGLIFLFVLTFAFGLKTQPSQAAGRHNVDKRLEYKLKHDDPSKIVSVIIQSRELQSLPGKLAHLSGKNLRSFRHFPGIAADLSLKMIEALLKDPTIIDISSDEPVHGDALTGTEEMPNSSSGGLLALNKWGASGQGIGVAVIDSGIAIHQDLRNDVYDYDFTINRPRQSDNYGHGTHVAGIIAGSGSRANGTYAGIAPNARLVDLKVLDDKGQGTTSAVIAAIDWTISNSNAIGNDGKPLNIRVINISLGHAPYEGAETDPLAVECRIAVKAGFVVVAAAGNYGKDSNGNTVYGGIVTPGIEPSVITVGAITTWGTPSRSDDTVASYSSRGPTIDGILKPDITAPGSRIISTEAKNNYLISNDPDLGIDNYYMKLSGTSMAAPMVAGAAAMILSKLPVLTPNAVKAILMYTAERRGSPLDWGAGYLNIAGAMDLTTAIDPTVPVGDYWIKPSSVLPQFDVINGYPATWGQTIVWDESTYTGNSVLYNNVLWGTTIVWGEDTIVWDETIVWGESVTMVTNVLKELAFLDAQTIVWGETIVWDESTIDNETNWDAQ